LTTQRAADLLGVSAEEPRRCAASIRL